MNDIVESVMRSGFGQPASVAYLVGKPAPGEHLPLERTLVVAGKGFEGDHDRTAWWKGELIPGREVTAMAIEVLRAMRVAPDVPGDNLITRGVDLGALNAGDRLMIGDVVLVRSEKPHRPCALFRQRAGHEAFEAAAAGLRGALFSVERSGEIAVGDPIEVVAEVSA
ncbi:MAG: MOSC domain-containing protein [Rhodothermales bacterium]|nr:MOSC domain-containing protein [Rhodothermales bacterium]MBO6780425.1 MOSC domain-containing protein [Rhodothermales bacterium]